jgi:hypothetical protein
LHGMIIAERKGLAAEAAGIISDGISSSSVHIAVTVALVTKREERIGRLC